MPCAVRIIRTIRCGIVLCDRYGLYVVDEANIETHGMVPMNRLTDDPRWLPAMSERVTRMVQRDRNHRV